MGHLKRLVEELRGNRDCSVEPARGQPVVDDGMLVPEDLREFYGRCGGVQLFPAREYPFRIVGPHEVCRANPEVAGVSYSGDISDSWYIVGRGGREEAISIDCDPLRIGRCYDSFWDRHGVAGDCAIVAMSFLELLRRLVDAGGGHWFWLGADAPRYGDAYAR